MEEQKDDDIDIDPVESEISIEDIEMKTAVYMSVYQIYNENVNDLMSKNNSKANKKTRQDSKGGFYIEGLTQVRVKTPAEVFKLMKMANANRTSHATNMNELSSRSHLIL